MSKITFSAAFTFLSNLSGVISLFGYLFNAKTVSMDAWDIIIKVVSIIATFGLAYYFLSRLFKTEKLLKETNDKIKFETQAAAILNHIRSERAFIRSFQLYNYYQAPNESDRDFWNRLPHGGKLINELLTEYEEAKKIIADNFTNKTTQEIEDFLKPLFPDHIFHYTP